MYLIFKKKVVLFTRNKHIFLIVFFLQIYIPSQSVYKVSIQITAHAHSPTDTSLCETINVFYAEIDLEIRIATARGKTLIHCKIKSGPGEASAIAIRELIHHFLRRPPECVQLVLHLSFLVAAALIAWHEHISRAARQPSNPASLPMGLVGTRSYLY